MIRLRTLVVLAAAGMTACRAYNPLEAHFNRGVAAYNEGRADEAIQEYKMAVQENPRDYKALFNLALIYHDRKLYDDARTAYARALEADPRNGKILANVASLQIEQGRTEEGLATLRQAAEVDRASAFPFSVLGAYYDAHGEPEKAKEYYDLALARERDHVETRFRLGIGEEKLGNLDAAIAHLEAAARKDPEDVPVSRALGRVYGKKADAVPPAEAGPWVDAAIHALERVTALQPARDDVCLQLGLLYERAGKYEKALEMLWTARDIDVPQKDPAIIDAVPGHLARVYGKLLERGKRATGDGGPSPVLGTSPR